jgi:hypothetical protein
VATRAERFRAEAERRAQAGKPKAKKRKARRPATQAARAALVARAGERGRIPHNTAPRIAQESAYELEVSRSGRPSRKSTRRSPAHVKAGTSLRVRRPSTRTSKS